jgi:hypothetical protein
MIFRSSHSPALHGCSAGPAPAVGLRAIGSDQRLRQPGDARAHAAAQVPVGSGCTAHAAPAHRDAGPPGSCRRSSTLNDLGQFVDAAAAQEAAHAGDARVVVRRVPGADGSPHCTTMLRNLNMPNSRPPRPTRVWRKSTGPPLSSRPPARPAPAPVPAAQRHQRAQDIQQALHDTAAPVDSVAASWAMRCAMRRRSLSTCCALRSCSACSAARKARHARRQRGRRIVAAKRARQDDRARAQAQVLGQHVAPGQQSLVQPRDAAKPEPAAPAGAPAPATGPHAPAPAART